MSGKKITKRRDIGCVACGKNMHVVFYGDKTCRGGHYFGKMPLYSDAELDKMRQSGTHKSRIAPDWIVDVYNYDPKPYAHAEYWECPKCYWGR